MLDTGVSVVDLFAGAGGLGLGAELAGGRLVLSVDNDSYSCETLRLNKSARASVIEGDVTTLRGEDLLNAGGLRPTDDFVVVGGAPCQPFSKAAYWVDPGNEAAYRRARSRGDAVTKPAPLLEAREDSRRTLVHEFLRLVIEMDAPGFVFENVPSILHPRNKHIFEALRSDAEAAGYFTRTVVGTATHFGVPQARQRVFLLGSKEAIPEEPVATHGEPGLGLQPIVTAGESLEPFSGDEFFEQGEDVDGRWAQHLREVTPGMNYKFHTAWAGHPSPTFETETRFWNFLLKLSPSRPSWTLAASPGPWTGPFHWDNRRLRTVEMAALQTFPADYVFAGPRRERIRQIGNAVPVKMGSAMIASVMSSIGAQEAAA